MRLQLKNIAARTKNPLPLSSYQLIICGQHFLTIILGGIRKKLTFIRDVILHQAKLKETQKNANINTVIVCHLVRRHNTALARLLVAVNGQGSFFCHYLPRLCVAGTWRKSYDVADLTVMLTVPYLIKRLALALIHILAELILGNLGNRNHNYKVKTVVDRLIGFAYTEPKRADSQGCEIQIKLFSDIANVL